jgi:ATP-binding protein involved in chromosome partitioning
MEDKIRQLLSQVKNPNSAQSLVSENRLTNVSIEGEFVKITYKRDGINPVQKREIESTIHQLLNAWYKEDKILIETISDNNSQDIFSGRDTKEISSKVEQTAAPAQPAQIKTGHGTVGNKRPVPGVKKVIAIGSGKGGVGKSTFTANLAVTLSLAGYQVGIIDADIYGPSIPMMFNKRFDKPFSNSERKILPLESHGVKFMSFGLFINEGDPVIWRGPMLGGVLNQFLFDVDWTGTDYLLIDLPPGTGDIQLSMVQNTNVDGAIVISTPQDIALLDATKGLEMFRKMNLPIIGMVENMSSFICNKCDAEHFIFGHGGVETAVKKLNVPFLGAIPLEMELRTSSDEGAPYMTHTEYEAKPVYQSYKNISQKVIDHFGPLETSPEKKGFFGKLFSKEKTL